MKNNYISSLLIAFAVGTLIFFAGAQACNSFPTLAKWMGGSCWLESSTLVIAESAEAKTSITSSLMKAGTSTSVETDDEVVKAAIYALAQSGTSEAVSTLKQIARTHQSVSIRKTALYALAQCAEDRELIGFYRELAMEGDVLELRKAAVYAIGQIGDGEAVAVLTEIAKSSYHVSLRKAAVQALQNCNDKSAHQALYDILNNVSGAL